jgi:hypothetical protein
VIGPSNGRMVVWPARGVECLIRVACGWLSHECKQRGVPTARPAHHTMLTLVWLKPTSDPLALHHLRTHPAACSHPATRIFFCRRCSRRGRVHKCMPCHARTPLLHTARSNTTTTRAAQAIELIIALLCRIVLTYEVELLGVLGSFVHN